MNKRKMKKDIKLEPIIFNTVNAIIMIFICVIMIYPFWNTIAVSFNDAQDSVRGGITLWPRKFSTYSYEMIFKNDLLLTAAINSVLRTVIATVLGVFTSSLIGFVLSREEFVWKKFASIFFLVTMYVSAGLIPSYFLIKDLHLLNSFWVYIFPGLISVFNVIIVKSYIMSLPISLSEAAMVDGAGYFTTYIRIILPCCKPVLATVALWCAVGAWNSWFDTFIYNSSSEKLTTLQYEMMKLLSSAMNSGAKRDLNAVFGAAATDMVTPTSMRAAVTIVASVPILIVYPFMQKYFVKGIMIGSVKG